MFSPWPHQVFGVDEVRRLIEAGERQICLTSPTRGGKSWMVLKMCEWGLPTLLLGNKTILVEQLAEAAHEAGIEFGVIQSGRTPDFFPNVQVASIQTLHKRWKAKQMELPPAQLVIIDEIHNETARRARDVVLYYLERGAFFVGITATPLGVDHLCNQLVVAGKNSDLRACGAIVPAQTYAPDEPTLKAFKKHRAAIMELRDEHKQRMLEVICGRAIEHFNIYNPTHEPSIGFPPGVPESLWFAERFKEAGIPSAHIDGGRIWLNGETLNNNEKNRKRLKAASQNRDVVVVFNRFVLREGVTYSWLKHCMFLCTFGSVKAYLQAGGRVLGQYYVNEEPQLTEVTIQDHGGNYWRHDSLNCDRVWSLAMTETQLQNEHDDAIRRGTKPEPIVCPNCAKVRFRGVVCPKCGHHSAGRTRRVIETNGRLREVHGDIYRPRRVAKDPGLEAAWKACVFRCRNSGRTMTQARALFMRENQGCVPRPEWDFIPQRESDWYRKAADLYPSKAARSGIAHETPLFDQPPSDSFLETLSAFSGGN